MMYICIEPKIQAMKERKMKTIKEYVSMVTSLIKFYLSNLSSFPRNAKLLVQRELGETVIDDPTQCRGCDHYNLDDFVKRGHDGYPAPNVQAIAQMASHYYRQGSRKRL